MRNVSRLVLYHYWVAFAVFLPAVALGAWQMLMRSPLPAPLDDPNAYYTSVTLHGTAMAYVITTFFAMGFGYAVAAASHARRHSGVDRLRNLPDGHRDGGDRRRLGPRIRTLYLLPATAGEQLVLSWRSAPHRRIDDLGRADDPQYGGVETR